MTKEEAQREAIRRWRALPIMQRRTFEQAQAFANSPEGQFDFHTMADTSKVVAAWLIRDLVKTEDAAWRP